MQYVHTSITAGRLSIQLMRINAGSDVRQEDNAEDEECPPLMSTCALLEQDTQTSNRNVWSASNELSPATSVVKGATSLEDIPGIMPGATYDKEEDDEDEVCPPPQCRQAPSPIKMHQ
jgi:hypothetical protein